MSRTPDYAVDRMLELSTYHIKMKTYNWIMYSAEITWYDEDETGVMIPITDEQFVKDMPDDLKTVMQTAKACNCGWLVLDPLAKEVDCLPSYHETWKDAEMMGFNTH